MKKTILAPAAALSLGLTGAFGAAAAPAFADTAQQANPTFTISADKMTLSEYSESGVTIKVENASPGSEFMIKKIQPLSGSEAATGLTITADETGSAKQIYRGDKPGVYAFIISPADDENRELARFDLTITPDEGDLDDIPVEITQPQIDKAQLTGEELVSDGVNVTYSGEPGDTITYEVYTDGLDTALVVGEVLVLENGKAVLNFKQDSYTGDPSLLAGDYVIKSGIVKNSGTYPFDPVRFTVTDGEPTEEPGSEEPTAPGTDEPTEPGDGKPTEPGNGEPTEPGDSKPTEPVENPGDEAEAGDPALKLSDKTITAADFVNDEKGIVATVNNLEPGTEVKYTVAGTSGSAKNVRTFEQTVKADDKGNAVFTVAGVDDKHPESYLGKYSITAEFDGQKLKDSFEVVSKKGDGKGGSDSGDKGGAEGGGSTNADSGASDSYSASDDTSGDADSGYLPRTGQGLGALAAGAALLTIGGATVLLTRRRRA